MCNKARVVHKIVSGIGRAPIYLFTKLLINRSSRNSSRKLNVLIDLFKSSLVYSGPALWNSLPSELRLPVSPPVFKKCLTLHMLSRLGVTWNHDHWYISPCAASTLCCAASGSPYLLCVCALCACSFRWQTCSYARAFNTDLANLYIYFFLFFSLSTSFSVYGCPFQQGLYKCTCTQHTVAHCILS